MTPAPAAHEPATKKRSRSAQTPPAGSPVRAVIQFVRRPTKLPACLVRRPVRVGFVVHVMQVAGAEVLVRETIRRLGSEIEPTIFCLDSIGTMGEELRPEGVRIECLHRRPGRDFGVASRLAAKVRERRIQVLHAHQYTPFFYAALAKARLLNRVRLIFTEHGRHFPDMVSPLRQAVNRLALHRFADAVNACSDFSAKALCTVDGFPGRCINVIPNGIDLTRYAARVDRNALRERIDLRADRRYVLCVARFHPVKDHATLLRMFAEVAHSHHDVDLLLAGDGPLRETLKQLALQLGISDHVRFLGIRADVPDLMRAADIFALTSLSEAASLTVIEAMAAAKPIVVTEVGGNPELIRDGIDGLLFPRQDSAAGAKTLVRLLDEPELANSLGASAQARAMAYYDLNATIERYHDLYRRLTGRGGGS